MMPTGKEDRQYWLNTMVKISLPVLEAFSKRRIKATMPVESVCDKKHRKEHCSHLEALARTLTGIAPWLECKASDTNEDKIRVEFCQLAREAIDAVTNETSPDYVDFGKGFQPLVESAFLCHAILRAPVELWSKLESKVKGNVINSLKATRGIRP